MTCSRPLNCFHNLLQVSQLFSWPAPGIPIFLVSCYKYFNNFLDLPQVSQIELWIDPCIPIFTLQACILRQCGVRVHKLSLSFFRDFLGKTFLWTSCIGNFCSRKRKIHSGALKIASSVKNLTNNHSLALIKWKREGKNEKWKRG